MARNSIEELIFRDSSEKDVVIDNIIKQNSDISFLDKLGRLFESVDSTKREYFSKENSYDLNLYLEKISQNKIKKFDGEDARRKAIIDTMAEMYEVFRENLFQIDYPQNL